MNKTDLIKENKLLRDAVRRLNEQIDILLNPDVCTDAKMSIAMTRELARKLMDDMYKNDAQA